MQAPADRRINEALCALDRLCEGLTTEESDRLALALAASICERAAYNRAGDWSSSSAADLLIVAAQIERFANRRRPLD